MHKNILITGSPGIGKTTLIQRITENFPGQAGGFYTQEIRVGRTRKGFEIITLDGDRGTLAHVDIDSQVNVSKYGVDLSTLENLAIREIRYAVDQGDLVVIDEIGPMEIACSNFREAVMQALNSDAVVLATIVKRSTPFSHDLKSRPDTTLVEVTRENRDNLVGVIISMLAGTET